MESTCEALGAVNRDKDELLPFQSVLNRSSKDDSFKPNDG